MTPAALEHSEAELLAAVVEGRPPGEDMQVERVGDGVLVLGPSTSPILRATGLGMRGAVDAAMLDRIERRNAGRSLPSRIDLCPFADATLRRALHARGYRVASFRQVLVGEAVAEAPVLPPGTRLRQVRADHPADVRLAASAVACGFEHGKPPPPWAVLVGTQVIECPLAASFVVEAEGAIVAGGTVSASGGIAWLSGASVLPAWRGRGLHRALVSARVGWAALHGCATVAMHVTPGGHAERTARAAGLEVRYTKPTCERPVEG